MPEIIRTRSPHLFVQPTWRPEPPSAELMHKFAFALHHGEKLIWAEIQESFLIPPTGLGRADLAVRLALLGVGVLFLMQILQQPLEGGNLLAFGFLVVWTIAAASMTYFAATQRGNKVFALTDQRALYIDLRIPFETSAIYRSDAATGGLRSIELAGPIAHPFVRLRGRAHVLWVVPARLIEIYGVSNPRETAELIRSTLGVDTIKDHTR
jgi:hypothetical protein